jgi:glycosyltransferase involved in cell wall biosynthesis
MKICFLAAADSIHSFRWVNFFAKQGYQITWISLRPTSFDMTGIEFLAASNVFQAIYLMWRSLRKHDYDIVHAHYAGIYGLIASIFKIKFFVLTAWGSDVLLNRKKFYKRIFLRWILWRAKIITTDAEHMIKAMVELGVSPKKILRINFGIDTDRFLPPDNWEEKNSQIVISTRNLEPIYDVESFIEAMPIVLNELPETKFTIVGKGTQEQHLKLKVADLNISNSVTFTGALPNNILIEQLQLSAVYVSTSLSDAGIAASTAEAMALSIPVVVTASGENNCWITDGENGFLVPVKDAIRLAEKIIILLKNKSLRNQFGHLGRETIRSKNDYTTEMNKMNQVYQYVIEGKIP